MFSSCRVTHKAPSMRCWDGTVYMTVAAVPASCTTARAPQGFLEGTQIRCIHLHPEFQTLKRITTYTSRRSTLLLILDPTTQPATPQGPVRIPPATKTKMRTSRKKSMSGTESRPQTCLRLRCHTKVEIECFLLLRGLTESVLLLHNKTNQRYSLTNKNVRWCQF